jgi:hypothetical protein
VWDQTHGLVHTRPALHHWATLTTQLIVVLTKQGASICVVTCSEFLNLSLYHENFSLVYFSASVGFELRSSCLQGRCFSTWTTPSALFILVIFAFFLFGILGFELRAACLLGRHFTTWATPLALFCDGFFRDRVSQTICLSWL